MPFYCSDYQRRTSWELDATTGHPVAECIDLAGTIYTAACPLCGCLHELPKAASTGAVIKPRCLLIEFANGRHIPGAHSGWKLLYEKWLLNRPDAPAHTQIVVRLVAIEELSSRKAMRLLRTARKGKAA